jgi:RHS repeat-associated protein
MKLKLSIFLALFFSVLQAQNFHDTQGKLEISNSGQSTYSLPIAMPPSIKDMGPIINLVYSSSQSGGIAGQGWSINNISTITRMSTRQDIEGFRDGVDFDADDKLSIDGQRLLLKTGNYWADGSIYETEVQSNTKIQLMGSGAAMYFIVTSPDGSRTWYGNFGGMNGTDATAYYIVRFEDVNGNFMTYHYLKPFNKSLCISEIKFSANSITNPTPLNKIVFTYKLASRVENIFIKGIKVEKAEILDKVDVFTNGLLFKKYQLSHITDDQGYQRVSKIQEFNGANESANPIDFEYLTTTNNVVENVTGYNDALNLSTSPDMSGDFDGDGKLDFISGNQIFTKLFQGSGGVTSIPFTSAQRLKFTATTLTNNKLNQKQSLVNVIEGVDNLEFKIYNLNNGLLTNSYNKTIVMDNTGSCFDNCTELMYDDITGDLLVGPGYPVSKCTSPTFKKTSNKYIEGDFNGDGISEVLILSYDQTKTYTVQPNNGNDPVLDPGDGSTPPSTTCKWVSFTSTTIEEARKIDLNPNVSTTENTAGNFVLNSTNLQLLQNGERYVMDFNSDGKADILMVESNKNYKVISFKQLTVAPWAELEIIGQGLLDSYLPTKQILFGDYNGDSKIDLMMPEIDGNCIPRPSFTFISGLTIPAVVCPNINLWHIYYSNPNPNGGEFFVKNSHVITDYITKPPTSYPADQYSYYAMDINKDGKSDLVKMKTSLWQPNEFLDPKNIDSSWRFDAYINNIGLNNQFNYYYASPDHSSDDNSRPIPLASNYKYKGLDNDLLVIRYHGGSFAKTVTFLDFKKDFTDDNLIKKVTQSGGAIIDEISYKSMEPDDFTNGLGYLDGFYSSTESLQYPLVELKQMPNNKIVLQLKNTSLGIEKKQDFKYHGLAINLNGIGIIGFKKTARSSWYRNISDKKNWSVSENDASLRGALVKSFTVLLDGNQDFNFGTNYNNPISVTENTYDELIDPISKRYAILLNTQTSTDYLTNIVTEKLYNSYSSDYFLPINETTNKYLGTQLQGSSTSITNYFAPSFGVGSNYHIGRPKDITTTTTTYVDTPSGTPDTKTSKIEYAYNNGNISQTKKTPNSDVVSIVEDFAYFSNGLLQSKTISATGTTAANQVAPRTTTFTYDTSNRFVKTIRDPELMVTTNLTYHNLYGTVLTQQNPFNKVTTSILDNWGKQTKVTDFLGKSITYTYARSNGIYTTTQVGDDGSSSIVESNALAQQVRKGSKDINGNWIYVTTEYDYQGKTTRESQPYFSTGSPTQWTTYEYDEYSRPIKTTEHTGKVVNTTYFGTLVSANDSVMTKSKTVNANGNVINAIDEPGGTITYKYDANGNMTESNYDGIAMTMTYDNWGRKTSLLDTSAGLYTYSYNAFGETLKEETPKGITTYTYNPVGKILIKKIVGKTNVNGNNNDENTNITSTYTYDQNYKWLTNIAVVNTYDGNSNYAYSYDITGTNPTFQLKKTIETLPFATFTKELTFDLFGRVVNEISTAVAHGKTSAKTITHTYKNGFEWQLMDGTSMKYQTNTTNARGQLTSATLGNGIAITNTYDTYGFSSQNKHMLNTTNVMTLDNVFEPVLGNLTSRYTSLFDTRQSFAYDNQDRLISWDGNATNVMTLPFNTTTDGFTFNGTSTTGSVSNSAGKLMVVLKNTLVSANKPITLNVSTGNKLRVKADITNKSGSSGVIVNAVIVETDPNDAFNYVEIPLGTINNGVFDSNYTVSDFVPNPILRLKFAIDESSPLSPNGISSGIEGEVNGFPPNTTFYVDNLKIDNISISTQNYDDRGRITNNELGQYQYTSSAKPYQNTSVFTTPTANTYYSTRQLQNVTYTAFKSPIKIEENGSEFITFGYNAMEQRNIMYYGNTNTNKLARPFRRYYSADGSMEVKATFVAGNTTTPSTIEFITYVGGDAYSAPALVKSDGTTQSYFYLHRDYQGSILAITNATGLVQEKRMFDAWGGILKIQNGAGINLTKLTFFDRGYTGHEHLEGVGLINMNARLYDPKLHRFLQPDNFIQDPNNTQNYNRYAYCINNPLKYTDITGNVFGIDDAIIIGIGIGLASYFTMNLVSGNKITLQGAFMAAFMGAVSGAVTFGIGEAFSSVTNFTLKATYSALAHGAFQGLQSGIQGGGFWSGLASGTLSSIASSVWQGGTTTETGFFKENNWAYGAKITTHAGIGTGTGTAGMIAFGSIMGGAGSALTGGNFWHGAVTGLVVSGLNHAMHSDNDDEIQINSKTKEVRIIGDGSKIDNIYVDGNQTLSTKHGLYDAKYYKAKGFKVTELYGVGMKLTNFVLDSYNTITGLGTLKMAFTQLPKASLGLKVGLGGSKTTLESSYFYTRVLGINTKLPFRLPTVTGVPTNNLGVFLGRNASITGATSTTAGTYGIVNGN